MKDRPIKYRKEGWDLRREYESDMTELNEYLKILDHLTSKTRNRMTPKIADSLDLAIRALTRVQFKSDYFDNSERREFKRAESLLTIYFNRINAV